MMQIQKCAPSDIFSSSRFSASLGSPSEAHRIVVVIISLCFSLCLRRARGSARGFAARAAMRQGWQRI